MRFAVRCQLVSALALAVNAALPFTVAAAQTPQPSTSPTATPSAPQRQHRTSRRAPHPAQSAVAAKNVAFATIPASSPALQTALKATDLTAAAKLVGKHGAFTGTVSKVFAPSSGSIVILDFAREYRTAITAVVLAKSFSAFPTLSALEGKTVLITGTVSDYHGSPQIVLSTPDQLQIVGG